MSEHRTELRSRIRKEIRQYGWGSPLSIDADLSTSAFKLMPYISTASRRTSTLIPSAVMYTMQQYAVMFDRVSNSQSVIAKYGWNRVSWTRIHMLHIVGYWADDYEKNTKKSIVDMDLFIEAAWVADFVEELYDKEF